MRKSIRWFSLIVLVLALFSAVGQAGAQTLYNGIVLPQTWPPSETATQAYQIPTYITNPPAVIPIDVGRQLFVDDFLVQQTTMTRTQHQPVMYPLNPIISPNAFDVGLIAMPFSDGAWFDPADQLFKMWLFCGGNPAGVCYAYSMDGKNWIRPSIPNAFIPNTDQVLDNGMVLWMDLLDPNQAHKFKLFTWDTNNTGVSFSPDGINWTSSNLTWPLVYDRTTLFWNPFRSVWVDSMKDYLALPASGSRPAYLSRTRAYAESPDLVNWTPAEPGNFATSYWTGPDVNDPPYYPGGVPPQLYNLDAVAYESLVVGLFSWFHPGPGDTDPNNLPGPDLVELGVGFSRDGFQWVRPTRGSGPGPNGAFIPASNVAGTWNMGNTQSAGGCFLVVGDELWFYFSGRDGLHATAWPNIHGSTGLATLRRDGFYSMDAGAQPAVLTTRPVQFSGKYMFVNVQDPQGSLQIQVLNSASGTVLATSLPLSVDKTLQAVQWNGIADLSSFANQPVEFRFTLTSGSLYAFWVSASTTGASNGYVAAGGPGYSSPTDNQGTNAYSTTTATPEIYPPGGIVSSVSPITLLSRSVGATIHYTTDGTPPSASSPVYTAPFKISGPVTVQAIALAPGLSTSGVASAAFTVDNTPPSVSLSPLVNGQTVSAGITLTASASSSSGIANVEFLVDGVSLAFVRVPPYTASLQTTTLTNAVHQISAIATNQLGIQATTTASVTVQNVFSGPTNGLVGYWSFDTAYVNGTTIFDQSGYNDNGTVPLVTPVLGVVGQALLFDGFSTDMQVPTGSNFDLLGNLSLSLWIQTENSVRNEALIDKYSSVGTSSGYLLRTTPAGTAELMFGLANAPAGQNVATDTTKINDGNWHHLVVVVSLGSTVSFYVDGVLSSTHTVNTTAGSTSAILQMGFGSPASSGTYFTGAMDEVRIYNRALSASEVSSLFAVTGSNPQPAAVVRFVQTDTTTQGNWKGVYGQSGYLVAGDSTSLPPYASVSFGGAPDYTWASSTTDPRALLKAASTTDRIASVYYGAPSLTADVNLSDGQSHVVALYSLDYSNQQRSQTVYVLDAATNALLDVRTLPSFTSGEYLVWNVTGHVQFYILLSSGPNAVVDGVFIGPPPGPDLTVAMMHSGSFTAGAVGESYTITVSNSGGLPTSGAVSLTESVPAGLIAEGISGSGWTCTQPSGPCSRSDSLAAQSSYSPITFTVSVAANPPSMVTNAATVGGGAEVETNNDTANDPTTIILQSNASIFLTSYSQAAAQLRDNFSGWVGFQMTVGWQPMQAVALGRLCAVGNSGMHTAKLVSASTGADVPGGTVSLNMAGCTAGQFVYSPLTSPITLAPNTAYYLVTQELNGGDLWYDHGAISSTSDAAVSNSIYSYDSSHWIPISVAGTSYVPPNLQYLVVPVSNISVGVQASIPGVAFSVDGTQYTTPQTFTWPAGSPHTVSAPSPQSAGVGTQYAWTSWSDGGANSHTFSPAAATTLTANFSTQYLLTATVTAPGGGSISLNPSSSGGYYSTGTSVTLTAVPSAGCTFTGWGGALSGVTASQSLTMSAPQTVSASFQCSGAPPSTTNFVTGFALNNPVLRNNFTGWVGMEITVGANPINVSALGRVVVAGNSGTHQVKFVRAADGSDVAGGSVLVPTAGQPAGQFTYQQLASPITLQSFTSYYLVSAEVYGGDLWYDHGTISATSAALVNTSVYYTGSAWAGVGPANASYVPVDFQYTLAAADTNPPFVTTFNLNNRPLRNDFTGWVGMQFTVGATPVSVSELGRIFVSGNSGTHTVKLVLASTGVDVPGGSVSLSMSGGTPGQFSYATLPSSITLQANTAYYLVTQESQGGDQWYDFGTITTATSAVVSNAIYWSGASWVPVGGANMSYVPPNFK